MSSRKFCSGATAACCSRIVTDWLFFVDEKCAAILRAATAESLLCADVYCDVVAPVVNFRSVSRRPNEGKEKTNTQLTCELPTPSYAEQGDDQPQREDSESAAPQELAVGGGEVRWHCV